MNIIMNIVTIVLFVLLMAALGYRIWQLVHAMGGDTLSTQLLKVREWLLWAVTEAEKNLGGGTGALKLRQVYDLFLQRFPTIAEKITFAKFSEMVDDVLVVMRKMLDNNQAVKALVGGADEADDN